MNQITYLPELPVPESAATPVARTPPSRRDRANISQRPVRLSPSGFAGMLQFAPAAIRGTAALPDSTGSDSLSRSSTAPAAAPRAGHLPGRHLPRRALRTRTSNAPTAAADTFCKPLGASSKDTFY